MVRRIPMEDFFRKPEKSMVRLSPDGESLSWLAPWKHRLNVFVKNLESDTVSRVTSATEHEHCSMPTNSK